MGIFSSALAFAKPLIGTVGKFFTGNSLGKTIAGVGTNLASNYLQNQFIGQPNADRAYEQSYAGSAEAFARSQQAYKTRYQNTVQDMIKAGINPIMAASSGFNVGNAPQMHAPQSFKADLPTLSGTSSALDINRSAKTVEEAFKIRAESDLVGQQELETVAKTDKLIKEWKKLEAETFKLIADGNKANQEAKNLKILQKKLSKELSKLRKIANVYDGPAGQYIAYMQEVMHKIDLALVPGLSKASKTTNIEKFNIKKGVK